jgi:hypothetical protein
MEDEEAMTLATYRRTGGGAPSFDEELEIEPDGAFRLLRRVSTDRVGTFAGTLDAPRRDQLIAALDALGTPVLIRPDRPGAVLELVDWAGGSASFPLEADLPPEWQRLRELLQSLVEDLKQHPVAALEVRLDDAADVAVLSAVGDQPITVDFDGAVFALSLFGEDEDYLDSTAVAVPADLADGGPLPPGWRRDIQLDHGLPFNPKRTLQLSVDLTVEGCESQLTCTAGKGWF